jgi:hypothetical protein
MWKVPPPSCSAVAAYETCLRNMRDLELKKRLERAVPLVGNADEIYRAAGNIGSLHDVEISNFLLPNLSAQEMSALYNQRMAAKKSPARAIYDSLRIASRGGKCPLCGHRDVMTLDHYLPKIAFPAVAVDPINLIPACTDCNKLKLASVPRTLHPYFDDIEDDPWLQAEVLQSTPAVVQFRVESSDSWSPALTARVKQHFKVFGLAALYASQAARSLSGIQHRLYRLHHSGGPDAVRRHLEEEARSWRNSSKNCWEAALYTSLAVSDWFCEEGFKSEKQESE